MNEDFDKIEFLKHIQQYYPVGFPYDNYSFENFNKLLELTKDKINLLNSNDNWNIFIKNISNELKDLKLIDLSATQFPSYEFMVELSDKTISELRVRKYIFVSISLLVDYYTIYFKNIYSIKNIMMPQYICYSENIKENQSNINSLNRNIRESGLFMEKRFVSHYFLFNSIIEGATPFGISDGEKTNKSIYAFLFGFDYFDRIINI